eukprot:s1830_g6.t1
MIWNVGALRGGAGSTVHQPPAKLRPAGAHSHCVDLGCAARRNPCAVARCAGDLSHAGHGRLWTPRAVGHGLGFGGAEAPGGHLDAWHGHSRSAADAAVRAAESMELGLGGCRAGLQCECCAAGGARDYSQGQEATAHGTRLL